MRATDKLFSRVTVIEISQWDWDWPQTIHMRLYPTIKPQSFRHRIRVLRPGWRVKP